jgi:hypothetical protein
MSEIHEAIEKAEEGEHGAGFNRRIALVIAILALFLSFSETLGKGAQTEVVTKNIEASDLWAFFQAKDIRRTIVSSGRQSRSRQAGRDVAPDRGALRIGSKSRQWPQGTGRGGQGRGGRARPVDREISPLRIGLGGVPDRHRAGFGGGDHRDGFAGLARRCPRRRRLPAPGARPIRAARGAVYRDVVIRHSGAERSEEPGIHTPSTGVMDSGLAAARQSGMTVTY